MSKTVVDTIEIPLMGGPQAIAIPEPANLAMAAAALVSLALLAGARRRRA